MWQGRVTDLEFGSGHRNDYPRTDLIVVGLANSINLVMVGLFAARVTGLTQIQHALGVVAMMMGFALGYIAFLNKKNKRDKWFSYLLIPLFLFFILELVLDYVLTLDFRSTAIVGPYILLYYVGLWGLIGYGFMVDKKWGLVTLATYFGNMILSILPYIQHFSLGIGL